TRAGARSLAIAAAIDSCVSPEKVGADAHSPQPVRPASVRIRTRTLCAVPTSAPAMRIGLGRVRDNRVASPRSIFIAPSPARAPGAVRATIVPRETPCLPRLILAREL